MISGLELISQGNLAIAVYCNCGINVNFAFLYTAIAVYTKSQEFKIQQKMGWFS